MADVATASNVADWIAGGPCPPCFPLAALRFGFGLHSPGPRDVDGKEDAEEETDDDDDDDTEGDDDAAEEDRLRENDRYAPGLKVARCIRNVARFPPPPPLPS